MTVDDFFRELSRWRASKGKPLCEMSEIDSEFTAFLIRQLADVVAPQDGLRKIPDCMKGMIMERRAIRDELLFIAGEFDGSNFEAAYGDLL